MENLKIKRKEYEVIEIISNDSFKCSFKDKTYLIKKYDPESENFYMVRRLAKTNVSQPKVKAIDKKNGYIVREYIEGELMTDYILANDFNENIYKQIFKNSYMARVIGLNLDYSLDKWMISAENLFYVGDYCEKYDSNKDFTKAKAREWFLSKELAEYYKKIGVLFDKNRVKDEYSINKELVLMTCKYYM